VDRGVGRVTITGDGNARTGGQGDQGQAGELQCGLAQYQPCREYEERDDQPDDRNVVQQQVPVGGVAQQVDVVHSVNVVVVVKAASCSCVVQSASRALCRVSCAG